MSPPLPEVPALAARQARPSAPLSLSLMVGLGLILSLLSAIIYSPLLYDLGISPLLAFGLAAVVVSLFGIAPLVLLWLGFDWARWLFIALTLLSYLFLLVDSEPPGSRAQEILGWAYYVYDPAMVIFLLTPAMRRHFASRKKARPIE